jgi:hypothetical protein
MAVAKKLTIERFFFFSNGYLCSKAINLPTTSVSTSGTEPYVSERPPVPRRVSVSVVNSKRPPTRAVTMSDISATESTTTGLQHKPSYRHVSAGTLFKTVQEGIQRELTRDMIPEDDGDEESITERLARITVEAQAGPGKETIFPSE